MMRFFIFICAAVLSAPIAAQASPLIRIAETIALGSTEFVEGDWYSLGGTVTLSGTINGDAYVGAGTVTVNAPIKQDLVVVSGAARINAGVGDDIRILAGDVTLAGPVGGDVIVIGGTLHITDTATVAGDVLIFGGSATIAGAVTGDVFAQVDAITIDAVVGGGVRIPEASSVTLAKSAHLKKGIIYSAPSELQKADTARVVGETLYTKTVIPGVDTTSLVSTILSIMILAFTIHVVFAKKLPNMINIARERKGTAALVGISTFIAAPILAAILFITSIGVPLGGIILALFVAYSTAAIGFAAVFFGFYADRFYKNRPVPTRSTTLVGALLISILVFISPLLAAAAVVTLPLGILVLETYRSLFGKGK